MTQLAKYLQPAFKGELLSEEVIDFLNLSVQNIFKNEKNVIVLNGNYVVLGDIHGYFQKTILRPQKFLKNARKQ